MRVRHPQAPSHGGGHFLGHVTALVPGFVLIIVRLAMGVTMVLLPARVVLTISPAVRIYVATGTTDLRRSIDAFSLKRKVRAIKKARSGMAIA